MTCLLPMSLALKKSVVLVAPAVMTVVVRALALTVLLLAARVVLWVPMRRLWMAATSLSRPEASTPLNPLFAAFAPLARQRPQAAPVLLPLTAKENNHVATRSSQVPQRAEGP
jgi:hypothetical protein